MNWFNSTGTSLYLTSADLYTKGTGSFSGFCVVLAFSFKDRILIWNYLFLSLFCFSVDRSGASVREDAWPSQQRTGALSWVARRGWQRELREEAPVHQLEPGRQQGRASDGEDQSERDRRTRGGRRRRGPARAAQAQTTLLQAARATSTRPQKLSSPASVLVAVTSLVMCVSGWTCHLGSTEPYQQKRKIKK